MYFFLKTAEVLDSDAVVLPPATAPESHYSPEKKAEVGTVFFPSDRESFEALVTCLYAKMFLFPANNPFIPLSLIS